MRIKYEISSFGVFIFLLHSYQAIFYKILVKRRSISAIFAKMSIFFWNYSGSTEYNFGIILEICEYTLFFNKNQ